MSEMLRNCSIEQSVTMECLNNAPGMQIAAAEKYHHLKALVEPKQKGSNNCRRKPMTLTSLNLSSGFYHATDMRVACNGVLCCPCTWGCRHVRGGFMKNNTCTTPNAQCTMHNAQGAMHNAQYTMRNAQCTMPTALVFFFICVSKQCFHIGVLIAVVVGWAMFSACLPYVWNGGLVNWGAKW